MMSATTRSALLDATFRVELLRDVRNDLFDLSGIDVPVTSDDDRRCAHGHAEVAALRRGKRLFEAFGETRSCAAATIF